jgi:hypothetical protein
MELVLQQSKKRIDASLLFMELIHWYSWSLFFSNGLHLRAKPSVMAEPSFKIVTPCSVLESIPSLTSPLHVGNILLDVPC